MSFNRHHDGPPRRSFRSFLISSLTTFQREESSKALDKVHRLCLCDLTNLSAGLDNICIELGNRLRSRSDGIRAEVAGNTSVPADVFKVLKKDLFSGELVGNCWTGDWVAKVGALYRFLSPHILDVLLANHAQFVPVLEQLVDVISSSQILEEMYVVEVGVCDDIWDPTTTRFYDAFVGDSVDAGSTGGVKYHVRFSLFWFSAGFRRRLLIAASSLQENHAQPTRFELGRNSYELIERILRYQCTTFIDPLDATARINTVGLRLRAADDGASVFSQSSVSSNCSLISDLF